MKHKIISVEESMLTQTSCGSSQRVKVSPPRLITPSESVVAAKPQTEATPQMEVEPVEPQSLKKLSFKSLKRALDLFSPIHGHLAPPDAERFRFFSLFLTLSVISLTHQPTLIDASDFLVQQENPHQPQGQLLNLKFLIFIMLVSFELVVHLLPLDFSPKTLNDKIEWTLDYCESLL